MIILQKISKNFGHRAILKDVSYNCPLKSRIALIGNNGAGKTTLLNILCGFDHEYEGEVIQPKDLRLGYLPQSFNPNPKASILEEALTGAKRLNQIIAERDAVLDRMNHDHSGDVFDRYEHLEQLFQTFDGYRIEEDAREILRGFSFRDEHFSATVENLSGGWRMRLEFAKILLDKPNFLILDEPTNHLDLPSIEWFEEYLKKFNGTILFVSHDKDLLNRLSTHVLHLRQGELTAYVGNFDDFLEAFSLKQAQNTHVAKQLKAQYDHIEGFVNRFRANPSKASMVQSRLKTLAKLRVMEDGVRVEDLKNTMQLTLKNPNPSGKTVISVEKMAIGYETPLVKNLSFHVDRGSRIAILGANGLGKSTLLKTLLGLQEPLNGHRRHGHNMIPGYFAQEHLEGLEEDVSVLENLRQGASHIKETEARALLGSLGMSGDNVLKQVKVLSGGERNRTALACLLAQSPNTLFLDEPTNHLDLSACENLANALADFSGTVIFVSHNRSFIQTVATHVLYLKAKGSIHLEKLDEN